MESTCIAIGILLFAFGLRTILRQLADLANIDPMTNLFNRRHLEKAINMELERCKRYNLPMAISFIDVDKFKQINDQLGHPQGDAILQRIANKLKKSIRTSDTLARYGGDEFVLLMPQTDASGANTLLSRLQQLISTLELPHDFQVQISSGIAVYPNDGDTIDQLIHLANQRMYESRRDSR